MIETPVEKIVLDIENVTVRSAGKVLFQNLNFTVKKGEQWLILGENGSGKTAFLKVIEGHFYVSHGRISRNIYEDFLRSYPDQDSLFSFTNLIASVPEKHQFKNNSNTSTFYYQQRYNSIDSEDSLTVENYLQSIYKNSILPEKYWDISKVMVMMALESLAEKQLIKLSNGETKRLLIAAAILKDPVVLLMDNPLLGLDVSTRNQFHKILTAIIESGVTVIMTGTSNEIPSKITNIGIVKEGKIEQTFKKSDFKAEFSIKSKTVYNGLNSESFNALYKHSNNHVFEYVVKLVAVQVRYGNRTILKDINWTIRQGERWILSGPNGSGKSTLLSLLNGDNPQAYANNVTLFDRKRGTGESIWEIKNKIGFVSPEQHQYFPQENSCLDVVESGFYNTQGLYRKSNAQNREIASDWLEVLSLKELATTPFSQVSSSKQRLCLLLRALVNNPALLILDEPCQGLDEVQQSHIRHIIEELCRNTDITIIYVTHHREEIPEGFVQELNLP